MTLTEETWRYFDTHFEYLGNIKDGVSIYNNPHKKSYGFIMSTDYGKINYIRETKTNINGSIKNFESWSPDNMTLEQIINKLKYGL